LRENTILSLVFFIGKNTVGKGKIKKDEMKNVNMVFLPRGNQDGPVFRLRAPYLPAFPSWFVHDSGFSGFRSRHGCGAAGAFYPSSSHPSFSSFTAGGV
jgi:hypothetical protein